MGKQKRIICCLLIVLTVLCLIGINKDLFRFEYAFLGGRIFDPEQDGKGDYLLSEEIILKPAEYRLEFEGSVSGRGSAVFLTDNEGNADPVSELIGGSDPLIIPFTVAGKPRTVRLGISYDPAYSALEITKISVISDHVLYKDSLLRHLISSLALLLLFAAVFWRIIDEGSFRRVFRCLPDRTAEQTPGILLLLTGIVCFPFFRSHTYIHAEDLFFHLSRIEGLAESLKAGYFPVRDQLFWLKDYGYGTGYFYPDVFLYFPALLRICGYPLLSVYRVFILLTTFAGICSVCFCTRRITGSRSAGLIAALLFAFGTYRLIAVYYRAGFGEIQSMIFIPLIVMGLYEMLQGENRSWVWFALGYLGILCSHVISLVLVFPVTAVALLLLLPKWIRNKQFIAGILKAVAFVIAADAFFLFPMAEQVREGGLNINILLSAADSGISLRNLNPWKHLFLFFHSWAYGEGFSRCIYPGWSFLLLPFLCVFRKHKKNEPMLRTADLLLGIGAVLMILNTDLIPWERFGWFLQRIQFSWRLLMPISVIYPMAAGMYAASFEKQERHIKLTVLCLTAVACGFPILVHAWNVRAADTDLFIMQDNRVCGREYMPIHLDPEYVDKNGNNIRTEGNAVITSFKREGLTFRFSWAEGSGLQRFSVPLILYKGFHAAELSGEGNWVPIPISGDEMGLIAVESTAPDGSILVSYSKTAAMRVGEAVTLLTWIVFAVILRKRKEVQA